MTRKEIQTKVLKLSEGVLETVTDLVLSFVYYQIVIWERPTTYSVLYKAPQETEKFLEKVNYQTIKRAVDQLISRDLVRKTEKGLILTEKGRNRLTHLLPGMEKSEPRKKGEVYLIFYDISDSTKVVREKVQRFLKNSGAIAVQESVFISTSNLREKLLTILGGTKISGQVLITKLGKDSLFGKENITDFLARVYKLDDLAGKYQKFLKIFSTQKRKNICLLALDFAFNSIYRNDPKLPAEFLPKNWPGYQALSFYQHTSTAPARVVC